VLLVERREVVGPSIDRAAPFRQSILVSWMSTPRMCLYQVAIWTRSGF
jgi:hypothetical protein